MKRITIIAIFLAFSLTVFSQELPLKKNGQVYNPDGIELVCVEGSGSGSEKGFYIGRYEITQEEWETVMGDNPSRFKGKRKPLERVKWEEVQVFLKKLNELTGRNYRLPTEAEWVYAATGGSNKDAWIYAGSNNPDEVAWYDQHPDTGCTHTVGTKKPNSLGLYDMTGNVWEWCSDRVDVSESNDYNYVARGGSWCNDAHWCRLDFRASFGFDINSYNIGFRVVLSAD